MLWPFVIGGSLAYLLNFLLNAYERKINKRWISLFLVYATLSIGIFLLFYFAFPLVIEKTSELIHDLPLHTSNAVTNSTPFLQRIRLSEMQIDQIDRMVQNLVVRLETVQGEVIPVLTREIAFIGTTIKNILLGVILSVYLLASKEKLIEQTKQLSDTFFNEKTMAKIRHLTKLTHHYFSSYFKAIVVNGLIVTLIAIPIFLLFKIPFAIPAALAIGITNLIPIFGPFIGGVPAAMMIFFVSPSKALIFILLLIAIQQFDANILTPRIVGSRIGIAPFWVFVSFVIFGTLFGIVGMILGVPLMALILHLLKDRIKEQKLKTESR